MFFRSFVNMRETNLFNIGLIFCVAFASGVLISCVNIVNTEGTLIIEGKVLDESSGTGIPFKNIIVHGLVNRNNKLVPIEAGQFSTDSSGCFSYSLQKIKDAHDYNFCFVGDSESLYTTNKMTLFDLEINAKYLSFSLSKLADLTITLKRKSKTPVCDTLSLSWESDGIYYWFLYPYRIINDGKIVNPHDPKTDTGLNWMGSNVNSTISTKVFADKKTKLRWELYRNGKRKVYTDTITCRRDFANNIHFTY